MKILFKKNKGMTLTELMLTIAIIGIIGMSLSVLLLKWQQFWFVTNTNSEIQSDARVCIDLMNRNIRQASAPSVVIDRFDSNQPPYSRIAFNKSSRPTIYYQRGRNLYEVSASTRIISRSLRCVQFVYPNTSDDSLLNIAATFEGKTYGAKTRVFQLSIAKVRIMN